MGYKANNNLMNPPSQINESGGSWTGGSDTPSVLEQQVKKAQTIKETADSLNKSLAIIKEVADDIEQYASAVEKAGERIKKTKEQIISDKATIQGFIDSMNFSVGVDEEHYKKVCEIVNRDMANARLKIMNDTVNDVQRISYSVKEVVGNAMKAVTDENEIRLKEQQETNKKIKKEAEDFFENGIWLSAGNLTYAILLIVACVMWGTWGFLKWVGSTGYMYMAYLFVGAIISNILWSLIRWIVKKINNTD